MNHLEYCRSIRFISEKDPLQVGCRNRFEQFDVHVFLKLTSRLQHLSVPDNSSLLTL